MAAGVPVVSDKAFLQAYSMLSTSTVFEQHEHENELDVMFRVARLPAEAIWKTRTALEQLRDAMNDRCVLVLKEFLKNLTI